MMIMTQRKTWVDDFLDECFDDALTEVVLSSNKGWLSCGVEVSLREGVVLYCVGIEPVASSPEISLSFFSKDGVGGEDDVSSVWSS